MCDIQSANSNNTEVWGHVRPEYEMALWKCGYISDLGFKSGKHVF